MFPMFEDSCIGCVKILSGSREERNRSLAELGRYSHGYSLGLVIISNSERAIKVSTMRFPHQVGSQVETLVYKDGHVFCQKWHPSWWTLEESQKFHSKVVGILTLRLEHEVSA